MTIEAFLSHCKQIEEETNRLFPSLSKIGKSLGQSTSDMEKLLALVRLYREALLLFADIGVDFMPTDAPFRQMIMNARAAEAEARKIVEGK